jgi:hypothetical protein
MRSRAAVASEPSVKAIAAIAGAPRRSESPSSSSSSSFRRVARGLPVSCLASVSSQATLSAAATSSNQITGALPASIRQLSENDRTRSTTPERTRTKTKNSSPPRQPAASSPSLMLNDRSRSRRQRPTAPGRAALSIPSKQHICRRGSSAGAAHAIHREPSPDPRRRIAAARRPPEALSTVIRDAWSDAGWAGTAAAARTMAPGGENGRGKAVSIDATHRFKISIRYSVASLSFMSESFWTASCLSSRSFSVFAMSMSARAFPWTKNAWITAPLISESFSER